MTDHQPEQGVRYHLAGPDASGSGHRVPDGFVVLGGSKARALSVQSTDASTLRVRDELLGSGVLIRDGDSLVFTADHAFTSPSQAAAVLLGRTANGNIEWRTSDGRTLKDVVAGVEGKELEFRRRWYQVHVERFGQAGAAARVWRSRIAEYADEALAIIDALRRNRDLATFGADLQRWAVNTGTGFNSFGGQMFINQLVKRSEDHERVAAILADALELPADFPAAAAKIETLADYVESIRVGAHPTPARAPFMLSYCWALRDPAAWPVMWGKSVEFLEFCTGEPLPSSPADRYVAFVELVRQLDDDNERFEHVAAWWSDDKPVFLDPVLCDRCAFALEARGVAVPGPLEANAAVLVTVGQHLGTSLAHDVSTAAGRTLISRKPSRKHGDEPRVDLTADWLTPDGWMLGVRLWLNDRGVAIGLRPGWVRDGWFDEAAALVEATPLPGFRVLSAPWSKYGEDVGLRSGMRGEFIYARWYERDVLSQLDLRSEVTAVSAALQPLLDELVRVAGGAEPPPPGDPLADLVEEFRRQRDYPTPADLDDVAERERFAKLLDPEELPLVDPIDLRKIWNSSRYGSPGPQSVLNTTIRDADEVEMERILSSIGYLCSGDDEPAVRIDRLLSNDEVRVRGLGESVMMKLLAISHPERFITVYPYGGTLGKRRMLRLLGIAEPVSESRGELQVQSNDLLRERLDRFFPNDPKGIGSFLYWYAERETEEGDETDVDPLDALSDELLVDRQFLADIIALLEEKGQVVFYGPPGTGKTYLARKLAEALVPDATRRSVVQFHPSTSYEDFFEGYRPETDDAGAMTYRLQPGPLAELVRRATDAPGKRHIMIIDEINRANLPKVLGELLFLLEYRDVPVRTLYRPDDPFELPKDVWIIGTMNTADRSIALVDAALRRRFHFVPFFPNHGPMQGLLERWLAAKEQPSWVGELVAQVNDELSRELGGPHLQLGPSYFMKSGIDEAALRRIWEYDIEPFIEDQFFGDPAKIDYFRFVNVLARYRESVAVDEPLVEVDDGEEGVEPADLP